MRSHDKKRREEGGRLQPAVACQYKSPNFLFSHFIRRLEVSSLVTTEGGRVRACCAAQRRAVLAKAYPGGEDMRIPLRAHL